MDDELLDLSHVTRLDGIDVSLCHLLHETRYVFDKNVISCYHDLVLLVGLLLRGARLSR